MIVLFDNFHCSDSTSDDIYWEEEVETETYIYKHGKNKEPEAYGDHNQIFLFYNQKLPKTLELMPEEYSKSFFFLTTIENIYYSGEIEPNKTKAWQDFLEGTFYLYCSYYLSILFWIFEIVIFFVKSYFSAKRLLDLDDTGEKLAENHVSNWDEIWNNGIILVEGNDYDYNLQGH